MSKNTKLAKVNAIVQCVEGDFLNMRKLKKFYTVVPILKKSNLFQNIILAIGKSNSEEPSHKIKKFCQYHSINYYCGDKDNVLRRLLNASKKYPSIYLIRVLLRQFYIDPEQLKFSIEFAIKNKLDGTAFPKDYNYNFSADIFRYKSLVDAYHSIQKIRNEFKKSQFQTSPSLYLQEKKSKFKVKVQKIKSKKYSKTKINSIKKKYKSILKQQNLVPSNYRLKSNCYNLAKKLIGNCNSLADIACGQGESFAYLSSVSKMSEGFDIDKKYINLAKKKYKNNKRIKFNLLKRNFKIEKKKFDVITSFHTLEHIQKKQQNNFIKMIYNCLNEKGKLFIEVPLLLAKPLGVPLYPYHLHEPTFNELSRMLVNNNFKINLAYIKNRHRYIKVKVKNSGELIDNKNTPKIAAFFKLTKLL